MMREDRRTQMRQTGLLRELGIDLDGSHRILDLGCGAGSLVQAHLDAGLDAYGCDLEFKEGPHVIELQESGRLRRISLEPYRLPFDDDEFDWVFSDQVLEHVGDHREVFREVRRVLKPGGVTTHVYPARWRPREPHVFVPFGGVIQSPWWLQVWARLGVRNTFQRGLTWRQTMGGNHEYLTTRTNYLSSSEVAEVAEECFDRVHFAEGEFLRAGTGRARKLGEAARMLPGLTRLYHVLHMRVLVCR